MVQIVKKQVQNKINLSLHPCFISFFRKSYPMNMKAIIVVKLFAKPIQALKVERKTQSSKIQLHLSSARMKGLFHRFSQTNRSPFFINQNNRHKRFK